MTTAAVDLTGPPPPDLGDSRLRLRTRRGLAVVPLYVPILIAAAFFLLPLVWMVTAAFKDAEQIVAFPPTLVPAPGTTDNFGEVMTAIPFVRYFVNSLVIALLSTTGALISSALAGFAFARLRAARGSRVLFGVVLATLMIPPYVLIIPTFSLYISLGWLNTYAPLTVPQFLGVGCGLYIFLLRQFFLGVPQELFDSAEVDGAGIVRTFWQITLPLAKPAMITVALFQFVASWNDFFGPLVYLTDSQLFTLPVATRFFQGLYGTDYGPMMAMSSMSIIPVVVLFLVSQRFFVRGISTTGIAN